MKAWGANACSGSLSYMQVMAEYYYDQRNGTVRYEPADDVVVAALVGYEEGASFRVYMDSILEAVKDTGCTKILIDASHHPNIHYHDKVWAAGTWSVKAENLGVTHMATIPPEEISPKVDVEESQDRSEAHSDIDGKIFNNYDEAVDWLHSY